MKYAAFSLLNDPSKTRVGSISADSKTVEEFNLDVDVSEDGVVAKTIMSMLKSFRIAALMVAQNLVKIFRPMQSFLLSHQNLSPARIPMSSFQSLFQQQLITKLN